MEWQPIETAPRDGSKILLADNYETCSAFYYSQRWWIYRCGDSFYDVEFDNPTHWMPLPKPPQQEQSK